MIQAASGVSGRPGTWASRWPFGRPERREGGGTLVLNGAGGAEVGRAGRLRADPGMVVFVVEYSKDRRRKAPMSWAGPNFSGNAVQYFIVLT
ncbi:hypothetical protein [Sphaerisporangium album]|uniref:hypothetical protein n=1 Tax=Sphaerisporangium album TaxID=509200 RepID=UPI0011C03BE9|nr:hypothetical protein [Sphaerisporangium album]